MYGLAAADSDPQEETSMRLRVIVIVSLLGMLGAATGASAQPLTPTFPGWERYFSVVAESFKKQTKTYPVGSRSGCVLNRDTQWSVAHSTSSKPRQGPCPG